MEVTFEKEPKAKIQVLKGSAFAYETADHLPKLHQCMIANGKRGAGKSVAITSLLRMYKKAGTMERILVISPTFESNKRLMSELDIQEEDVFDPEEPGIIEKIRHIVNSERDEYMRYQHLKRNFQRVMRQIESGLIPRSDEMDDYLMYYYDYANNTFRMPKPRYACYDEPRPPVLALFIDDSMCSKLFTNRKFPSMVMKHRHEGAFPTGGAVGISLFIAIQTYKANSGLPKCIRNQATSICLFRTKDKSELKQISESFSGEIDPEMFLELYELATKDNPHDFLFVDLHKKPEQPSMFRRNFDEYIIIKKPGDTEKEE